MATIEMKLTAVIDGEEKTISRSGTVADEVMPHFFDAYREVYGKINAGTDEKPELRDMTDEETFARYAAGISAGTLANVQSHLRAVAHRQAEAAIPTIEVSPTEG